jgi:TonB family protein
VPRLLSQAARYRAGCAVFALTLFACAQQASPGFSAPTIEMSESEMASRLITKVPADYPPTARAAHIEGNVLIKAIVGPDGSVVQAQIVSGHPMLAREALLSVSKWKYQPVVRDGSPVEVATTVTIAFKLSDQPQPIGSANGAAMSVVDSNAASAEIIQLTNGRTIHADSITDVGEKIEYTIGESTYQISKSSVNSISHSGSAPTSPSPTVVPNTSTPPETIELTDGRIIHADSITYTGQKIEYTLAGSIYEVPKSLIKSMVHEPGAAPLASASTTWDASKPATATVTGTTIPKLPIAFGEDPKNWFLLESTEQLREECRTGEFATRFHPEMQSASSFPDSDDAQRLCAVLSGKVSDDYERLVGRGIEIKRTLCYTPGYVPGAKSSDPKLAAMLQEFSQISAEFGQRMTEFQKNPRTARNPGLRLLLDMYRLSSNCGHGSGF